MLSTAVREIVRDANEFESHDKVDIGNRRRLMATCRMLCGDESPVLKQVCETAGETSGEKGKQIEERET